MDNYRAISILSSISKLYEINIKEQLEAFFTANNLLSPSQHGFTKKKSTDTALCEFQNRIVSALDKKKCVLGLFIDFSRAFDCVNHDLLLDKLSRYGVRGLPLSLLNSYLYKRRQVVKVGKSLSTERNIEDGVPQGSILGPFLYLAFANDLLVYLNKNSAIHCTCYADDTNILIIENDMESAKNTALETYKKVITWSEKNNLMLNEAKTNVLNFKMNTGQQYELNIFVDTALELNLTKSTKLLGVVFDDKLQWRTHIDNLCNKLRKACYSLRFLSNHCSKSILLTVYYANFNSHLRYGILNWGTSSTVSRVFCLQKHAIRIIAKLGYRDSCRQTFQNLNVLTIAGVYIMEACTYIYRNRNTLAANRAYHNYSTRNAHLLLPSQHRTALYQRSFEFQGCKIFNKLTDNIRNSENVHIFKSRLKQLLMSKNCYSIDEFYL